MRMEQLSKTQLVLLVLLVSFMTSLVTGIVTVTLVAQGPVPITDTVHRVVEKTIEKVVPAEPQSATAAAAGSDGQEKEAVRVITQEDLVVETVSTVSPAVGSVIATKDIPVLERVYVDPFGENSPLKEFFPPDILRDFLVPQLRQNGTQKQEVSSGTGFFVSADGLILTNRHVVADTKATYTMILNDESRLDVDVLARDPIYDIAVLKVRTADRKFSFISFGDSDSIKVGQNVIAIGNALGEFRNTVSVGVVSGLQRTVVASGGASTETLQGLIQTDAAINPGNSGGPLLDLVGAAIGINTAVAEGAQNVGFALPINLAKKAVEDVRTVGRIQYPFLGVRYIVLNDRIKEERKFLVNYGALLVRSETDPAVLPNSPAAKAGLTEGDIILEFAGERVTEKRSLAELILEHEVGETVRLSVMRDNKTLTVDVVLGERPSQ